MKVYTSLCLDFLQYGLFSVSTASHVHFLSAAYYYTVNLNIPQTETNKAAPGWIKNKLSQCLVVTAQTASTWADIIWSALCWLHSYRRKLEGNVCVQI